MLHLKRVLGLIALLLILGTGDPTTAADRGVIRDRLLTARAKFAERKDLEAVYLAKRDLNAQIAGRLEYRAEVIATAENLKIAVDGFPARRNSSQQEVYQGWLNARSVWTELDRQVAALRSQMGGIDEMVLLKAQQHGKHPGPMTRYDILAVYPEILKQSDQAFESLRSVVAEGVGTPREADRLLRELNADLNRSDRVDDRFGPVDDFLAALRRSGSPSPAPRTPRRSARR